MPDFSSDTIYPFSFELSAKITSGNTLTESNRSRKNSKIKIAGGRTAYKHS
jgi:hypothetical protein